MRKAGPRRGRECVCAKAGGASAGGSHTAMWTDAVERFTFGNRVSGRLGHGGTQSELVPRLLEAPRRKEDWCMELATQRRGPRLGAAFGMESMGSCSDGPRRGTGFACAEAGRGAGGTVKHGAVQAHHCPTELCPGGRPAARRAGASPPPPPPQAITDSGLS